jgi:hypothetical protein
MAWTNKPSGDGYYWFRRPAEEAHIVLVSGKMMYRMMDDAEASVPWMCDPSNRAEWWGPILEPA